MSWEWVVLAIIIGMTIVESITAWRRPCSHCHDHAPVED